jgi:hypothetical protein
MRDTKTTGKRLIEDNIIRKRVLPVEIADTPADPMFLVPNKDRPEPLKACFRAKFIRHRNIAITPPDPEMREIRLPTSD